MPVKKCSKGRQARRQAETTPPKAGVPPGSLQDCNTAVKLPNLKPKEDLQVDWTNFEQLGLFTAEGVLDPAEALAVVSAAEAFGFEQQSSLGPAFGEAFRDNGRIAVTDRAFAAQLWKTSGLDRIFRNFVPSGQLAAGLNPNLRIYKYVVGQRFGRHIDESVDLGNGDHTLYTLLIYLSVTSLAASPRLASTLPRLEGGETAFYGVRKGREVARIAPICGLALVHRHGDDCLEHEALVVRQGVKYVLRSDVVFPKGT